MYKIFKHRKLPVKSNRSPQAFLVPTMCS